MPTAYIKKLAEEGHGSVSALEKKWDKAKAIAADEGRADDYAYITGIFKRMSGVKASVETDLFIASRVEAAFTQHLTASFKGAGK